MKNRAPSFFAFGAMLRKEEHRGFLGYFAGVLKRTSREKIAVLYG